MAAGNSMTLWKIGTGRIRKPRSLDMTQEEKELQDPGTWDFGRAVVSPGTQKARAVVSVAFARDDFEQVARAARQGDMKTSEFIGGAALAKAKAITQVTSLGWSGISMVGLITDGPFVSGTSTEAKPTVIQSIAVNSF